MKKPVFIDSNIWLYAFLRQDEGKRQIAKEIILAGRKDSVCISPQVINEVCYNLKKNNFPEVEIKKIISSFFGDYRVIAFTESIIGNASDLRNKYYISFWDSLIVSAALSNRCEILYSEDMQANQLFENKLRVINPFE